MDGDGDDADDADNEEDADEGNQPGNHWAATQEPQQPNLRKLICVPAASYLSCLFHPDA